MTKNIQEILSPLLIISYACGLKIVTFRVGELKQWFSFLLYVVLVWAVYNFVVLYATFHPVYYTIEYHVCVGLHFLTAFVSIAIGVYYDKIFRSCIRKLTIVDDTLEKLGTPNYHKLKMKILWCTLGLSTMLILFTGFESFILIRHNNTNILAATVIPFMRSYCTYINTIGDLIIASILRYIELKFDQTNEYLTKLSEGNKRKMNITGKHSMLRPYKSRFSNAPRNEYNKIWIVMHLHSELRKISRKIDTIFGIQMTLEMGCYFTLIAVLSKEIFRIIYYKNHISSFKMLYIIIVLFWLFMYIFRLFLINYACERVSNKASVTRDFINRFSHTTCNSEIRENILQFLLQITQLPLKFYGLGLFEFGFKFLYGFFSSVLTVLVIYTQAYTNDKL
ncbi:PREDICTED: uncharacterized protein LOC105562322 [Vollenhovia emeryi]|uniref:uncharacterized protein LOC105562322 n=1 Tax=Vollenhovia emeryi TaxID=411798 RepID=UPI0005F3D810|nr:PREDICTED: uncharacterized protein LOC105562322 [Vollenhovia emeryi]